MGSPQSKDAGVQVFGGPWSLIKIDMVEKYIRFFNIALKDKPFDRVYIDAFAGSGAFRYIVGAPKRTLFGPRDESQDIHAGSAQRALRANPPFDRIFFIERHKSKAKSLQKLIEMSGHQAATVEHGDANELLRKLCRPDYWRKRRGVIFLDPFGMKVEWSTLKMIAATQALDVWFLFALAGTIRNLPRLASRLDAGKRAAVTRVLGTEEWFEKFYKVQPRRTLFVWRTPGKVHGGIARSPAMSDTEADVRRLIANARTSYQLFELSSLSVVCARRPRPTTYLTRSSCRGYSLTRKF